jgi:hypothetical protein
MFKVKDDGILDIENLVSAPGASILMEELDNLEPLYPPQQAFMGYNEANIHKAEFTDATFSHKNFGAQSRQATATEVATSASMMATVLGRMVQRCENKDIEQVLIWFDESEKQMFDPNAQSPYARYDEGGEDQFKEVSAEVIFQPYTWKAQGSGFTHMRETRVQQLFHWGAAMAKTPAAQGTDWEELGRAALRDMGRRDSDKILPGVKGMMKRAQETGEVPPQLAALLGQGPGGAGQASTGGNHPAGLAPLGGGAIPNEGGAEIPGAGQGPPLE